jgi:hypothetical protein
MGRIIRGAAGKIAGLKTLIFSCGLLAVLATSSCCERMIYSGSTRIFIVDQLIEFHEKMGRWPYDATDLQKHLEPDPHLRGLIYEKYEIRTDDKGNLTAFKFRLRDPHACNSIDGELAVRPTTNP